MGQVFLAKDQVLDRRVAIKMISEALVQNAPAKSRFLREARMMATIEHSNVVRVYGFGSVEGKYYLVMEYVEGQTLNERIRQQEKLSVAEAISIVSQTVEGLEAAWEKQIVHRDVKPSNIFLDKKNRARIGDFGLAKPAQTQGSSGLTQTESGVLLGTPAYSSPEQIQGLKIDFRSDIYSLGIVFYEMLAGQTPFIASTPMAMLSEHLRTPFPSIRNVRPSVSKDVDSLMQWMTQKDPNLRPGSYAELYQETQSLASGNQNEKKILDYLHGIWRDFLAERVSIFIVFSIAFLVAFAILFLRDPQHEVRSPEYRQLTYLGDVKDCSLSPDGKYVAYLQDHKLMVQELSGGRPIQIYELNDIRFLRWSPDSSKLLFKDSDTLETVIIPKLGGTPQRVQDQGISCWSPDALTIAHWVYAATKKAINFTNISTGARSSVELPGDFDILISVDWSSNGRLLYLTRTDRTAKDEIWTIQRDGKQSHKIHEQSILTISTPRWSSRADAIYFLDTSPTLSRVMKIKIDPESGASSSSPVPLLTGLEALETQIENLPESAFSYSSEANRIAYLKYTWHSNLQNLTLSESADRTNFEFKTVDLIKGTRQIYFPRYSPDGKHIAYSSFESGKANIFVMPVHGGGERQLTFMNSRSTNPAWSADGKEIAFLSAGKVWKIKVDGSNLFQFKHTHPSPEGTLHWAPSFKILYQGYGNKMYYFLDPLTGNESPLMRARSLQWIFYPVTSPANDRIALKINRLPDPGPSLWVIELKDMSEKMLRVGMMYPLKWSNDGQWIYVNENGIIQRTSTKSGDREEIKNFPFTGLLEGSIDVTEDGRQFAVTARTSKSDIWIVDNFDSDLELEN